MERIVVMPTTQSRSDYIRHWRYRRDRATLHRFVKRIRQAVPHLLPEQRADLLGALSAFVEDGHAAARLGPDAA
jgi:hypothetical protein